MAVLMPMVKNGVDSDGNCVIVRKCRRQSKGGGDDTVIAIS